jgi:F-type H+-transporting ATPase subunit alpha
MKKVSGSLKLELASYREMAAFAQFSSDLDPETLKIIERGQRMTELLKQPDNNPIPFEKQSCVLFAGTSGFLDKLPVDRVLEFEAKMYEKLESSHKVLAGKIRDEKVLNDDIKDGMNQLSIEVLEEMAG